MSNRSDKESEPKGFAGFDSLVSNVDKDIADAKRAAPDAPTAESTPKPQTPRPASPPEASNSEPAAWQSTGPKPTGRSGKGWWWVIGIAIFIWVVSNQGNKKSTGSASSTAPSTQASAPSNTGSASASIVDDVTTSTWNEEKPSPGVDRVLGYSQIRYCVAEDIRLKTMEGLINQYADVEVEGFNAYVSNYNSRCGKYRYRSGSLESVQREAESHRADFVQAGRSRVLVWRSRSNVSPSLFVAPEVSAPPKKSSQPAWPAGKSEKRKAAVASAPPAQIDTQVTEQTVDVPLDVARRSSDSGKPDLSRASVPERAAIERSCDAARQYMGPKDYYSCLNRELAKLGSYNGKPDLSGASSSERAAIERSCDTARQYMGPGDYYSCLTRELSKLGSHAGKPDMSDASPSERTAIERSCDTARQHMGPGDYYSCISRELGKLESTAGKPDLSGASPSERAAIERSCDTARQYMGPGDYYSCLKREFVKLSSYSGKPDISRVSVTEQSAIEKSCQTAREYMGPGDYYACLKQEMAQLGYR